MSSFSPRYPRREERAIQVSTTEIIGLAPRLHRDIDGRVRRRYLLARQTPKDGVQLRFVSQKSDRNAMSGRTDAGRLRFEISLCFVDQFEARQMDLGTDGER